MRGSQSRGAHRFLHQRIIPAHAGLTQRSKTAHGLTRDHPRACGAHQIFGEGRTTVSGSSPRMRGSPKSCCKPYSGSGIIPAHAGLTRTKFNMVNERRDHPRACGAHSAVMAPAFIIPGSSPRMRGSPDRRQDHLADGGIIPAHAGLTQRSRQMSASCRDHPRACGAHTDWEVVP